MLLTGCTSSDPAPPGPVDVAAPAVVPDDVRAVCARVTAGLPESLGAQGLSRRAVTGDASLVAAWGDPAVTLVCGSAPADPTFEQFQLGPPEGGIVTFALDDVGAATAFTTVDLPVPVTVTVPDAYDSTALVPVAGVLLREDR